LAPPLNTSVSEVGLVMVWKYWVGVAAVFQMEAEAMAWWPVVVTVSPVTAHVALAVDEREAVQPLVGGPRAHGAGGARGPVPTSSPPGA
jgi:hypothetical protein